MRKPSLKITMPLLLTVVIATSGYVYADRTTVTTVSCSLANVIQYKCVDGLEVDSSLLVKVKVGNTASKQVGDGTGGDAYTLTDVQIIQLIKDMGGLVKDGQTVTVIEPMYQIEDGLKPGKTYCAIDLYTALVHGAEYLLSLHWHDKKQAYEIHALHFGKINLDNRDREEIKLTKTRDDYSIFRKSVIGKYGSRKE